MKTKHLVAGAAGLSFAGLVAYTTLNDSQPDIPENLSGTLSLSCNGTVSPTQIVNGELSSRQEEAIEAAPIDLHLHFTNGQITNWHVTLPSENVEKSTSSEQSTTLLSNIEIASRVACATSADDCTPKKLNEKSYRLFEYSYIIQQQTAAETETEDEDDNSSEPSSPAPAPAASATRIKGYGIISTDFRYFAGLQELDGETTTTALGCQPTNIKQTHDLR